MSPTIGSTSDLRGIVAATTPKITNVAAPSAGTEYSLALQNQVKQFSMKARGNSIVKFAFISSESLTNYVTIPKGCEFSVSGVELSTKTVYFNCSLASETVEFLEWT